MNNLQEATERICELKGNLVALDALCSALLQQLPPPERARLARLHADSAEAARTMLLGAAVSEHTINAFEHDVSRIATLLESLQRQEPAPRPRDEVESLLLAVPRVSTFLGQSSLTGASGFFFERDGRLYLVTSRHVLIDEPSKHFPDRIEIEVHTDERNLAMTAVLSLLLYEDGKATWRQASDIGGEIDVAVIEIEAGLLGAHVPPAFTPAHLQDRLRDVEIGEPLLVVGFPLGFHDHRHHLPVARRAAVASSFGTRFQGQGLFLTDARTHRGSSGAPVVMRSPAGSRQHPRLPFKLLGIHSSRMDMGDRDLVQDESLGLNCAWYADVLMILTAAAQASAPAA